MNEAAGHLPRILVSLDTALECEFEEAVRGAADLAVRVAFSVLRQREDAEEVAQEAFTRACPRFRKLRTPEQFRGWIVRVTWRLAIDRWRADRRRQAREQRAGEAGVSRTAEEDALAAERSALLWKAVDALPEKLRVVIILSAMQGHGVRDVAQLLGIPEGTVK